MIPILTLNAMLVRILALLDKYGEIIPKISFCYVERYFLESAK